MLLQGGNHMKAFWTDFILMLVLGILLASFIPNPPKQREDVPEPSEVQPITPSWSIPVRFETRVKEMDLEEYLVGAVLGEMPEWFEKEALKAQAVAARTFALKAYETGGKHGDGSVCIDPGCCQAYREPSGDVDLIRKAVYETAGQVLTYEGELIDAVYFSCSGGSTEDAAAVWGQEVPYLQSVDSPGEEDAAAYFRERRFSRQELEKNLEVELSGKPGTWFQQIVYTAGGGVENVQIGGKSWTGVELRRVLGLSSTRFKVEPEADSVLLYIYGYGHRVGMSQYGADAMAAAGADYREILSHYYSDTKLTVYSGK